MRQGVSVQMPVTTNAVAMPAADAPDSLIVAVTAQGKIFWEVTAVTPAQVTERAKGARKTVFLKADARTAYSVVAQVFAALRDAGVESVVLLSGQRDANDSPTYVLPKGLAVRLSRTAAAAAPRAASATFADVVHAVDVCAGVQAIVSF
jgi:hypothetical protein